MQENVSSYSFPAVKIYKPINSLPAVNSQVILGHCSVTADYWPEIAKEPVSCACFENRTSLWVMLTSDYNTMLGRPVADISMNKLGPEMAPEWRVTSA